MKTIKKILVPTDFSDLSFTALDYVLSTMQFHDAKIFLMYIVNDKPALEPPMVDLHSETALRDDVGKAMYNMDRLVFRKAHGRNVSPVVRRGEVFKEIIEFAREKGIDLIIMATHGRTGLSHVLMGSVAEKVVRHAPVPVLTVKPESMWNNLLAQEDVEEQLHLES